MNFPVFIRFRDELVLITVLKFSIISILLPQERLVEEVLSSVLLSYLKRFPREPTVLQTQADLQFASSQYRS